MYRLKKLELLDGKDSLVEEGYSVTGNILSLYNYKTDEKEVIFKVADVKVGWQVVLAGLATSLRTSPIADILDIGPNEVRFKTQTSVYLLEKLND